MNSIREQHNQQLASEAIACFLTHTHRAASTGAHTYTGTYTWWHSHTLAQTLVRTHTYWSMHTHTLVYTYIHTLAHTHWHIHTLTCIHTHTQCYTHTHILLHTNTTHTYAHTHTHQQTPQGLADNVLTLTPATCSTWASSEKISCRSWAKETMDLCTMGLALLSTESSLMPRRRASKGLGSSTLGLSRKHHSLEWFAELHNYKTHTLTHTKQQHRNKLVLYKLHTDFTYINQRCYQHMNVYPLHIRTEKEALKFGLQTWDAHKHCQVTWCPELLFLTN